MFEELEHHLSRRKQDAPVHQIDHASKKEYPVYLHNKNILTVQMCVIMYRD